MKTVHRLTAAILAAIIMLFSLASCGDKYISSYSALMLVRNQAGESCEARFGRLDGQLVFKLNMKSRSESDIRYTASLEEGSLSVYYDIFDSKESLFEISAGQEISSSGGYVEGGRTVYIIIEAEDGARGSVSISIGDED